MSKVHFPLPQPVGRRAWQPLARLARHHDDLTTVVSLVCHEVGEHMADVKREVAPHVALRGRDPALGSQAELEQRFHPDATPFQCRSELPRRDPTVIDASWSVNAANAPMPGPMSVRGVSTRPPAV